MNDIDAQIERLTLSATSVDDLIRSLSYNGLGDYVSPDTLASVFDEQRREEIRRNRDEQISKILS